MEDPKESGSKRKRARRKRYASARCRVPSRNVGENYDDVLRRWSDERCWTMRTTRCDEMMKDDERWMMYDERWVMMLNDRMQKCPNSKNPKCQNAKMQKSKIVHKLFRLVLKPRFFSFQSILILVLLGTLDLRKITWYFYDWELSTL